MTMPNFIACVDCSTIYMFSVLLLMICMIVVLGLSNICYVCGHSLPCNKTRLQVRPRVQPEKLCSLVSQQHACTLLFAISKIQTKVLKARLYTHSLKLSMKPKIMEFNLHFFNIFRHYIDR